MSTLNETTVLISDSLPDRLKLEWEFDAEKLKQDTLTIVSNLVQPFYIYYSAVPLLNDIKDPQNHDFSSSKMLEGCSYLQEIFKKFKTEITSVRLMRLEGGGEVKEHCDPTLDAVHREVVRLTLPIYSDDNVVFYLNQSEVPMKPGELWYMKLSDPHRVLNNGQIERINMSIDLVWNDWLEKWLGSHLEQNSDQN